MSEESSSLDITPEMALKYALRRINIDQPDKLLVIMLWDGNGKYDTGFENSGLSASQIIALLEIQKHRILEAMKNNE